MQLGLAQGPYGFLFCLYGGYNGVYFGKAALLGAESKS